MQYVHMILDIIFLMETWKLPGSVTRCADHRLASRYKTPVVARVGSLGEVEVGLAIGAVGYFLL